MQSRPGTVLWICKVDREPFYEYAKSTGNRFMNMQSRPGTVLWICKVDQEPVYAYAKSTKKRFMNMQSTRNRFMNMQSRPGTGLCICKVDQEPFYEYAKSTRNGMRLNQTNTRKRLKNVDIVCKCNKLDRCSFLKAFHFDGLFNLSLHMLLIKEIAISV